MKAVGYIRVSSEMQIETGHSPDAQRTLITDFINAKAGRWVRFSVMPVFPAQSPIVPRSKL